MNSIKGYQLYFTMDMKLHATVVQASNGWWLTIDTQLHVDNFLQDMFMLRCNYSKYVSDFICKIFKFTSPMDEHKAGFFNKHYLFAVMQALP